MNATREICAQHMARFATDVTSQTVLLVNVILIVQGAK